MKRTWMVILLLLVFLVGVGVGVWEYLSVHNEEVKEWNALPAEVKKQAIWLEIERPFYYYFDWWKSRQVEDLPDSAEVMQAIFGGADWLIRMQEESGRYNYWYDPVKKKFSGKWDDNFLRQAGTGYSMIQVYELTESTKYLESAKRSLSYQLQFLKSMDEGRSYFLFDQKAKLGGIAVPMFTMLKIRELEGDYSYDSTLIKLANMIEYLQQLYGTGQYKSTYIYQGDYEYEKTSNWESVIYPGEAMLAMALMYKQFGKTSYKTCIDRAIDYYYSDTYDWTETGFIPWTTTACVEMYLMTREERYAEFVLAMTDDSGYWQNMNPERPVVGSRYGLPTVFTSPSIEGLMDAVRLVRVLGDHERESEYIYRAKIAFKWLISLQYQGEDVHAFGGFIRSPVSSEMRIDGTQHAITALTKGIRYIYQNENR